MVQDNGYFMALSDDLISKVKEIFRTTWAYRNGTVVPSSSSVLLGNNGVKLDGTVLYADLDGSTNLVDSYDSEFAAEIYKTYLHCAAKIIRSEGGDITAYDGDRIMAVFVGDTKNTCAVRSAFKINYAVNKIINPALKAQYSSKNYTVKQVIGIDTCNLLVANTGIRGSNDLVWVGRAANYAAKLASLPPDYPIRITEDVYNVLHNSVKNPEGSNIWSKADWKGIPIYRANYEWTI